MKKNLCVISIALLLFACIRAEAQSYHPTIPPGTYRSKDNPLYWKNKMPYPGYWQQDVNYKIDATIDETTDVLDGKETLTYWNNSPDTLPFVFFHLYQNLNNSGGYVEDLTRNNHVKPTLGKYEAKGLGETIESITNNGKELKTIIDFTVMKVLLDKPILPGDSIVFDIKFKTRWDDGSLRRRFKKFDAYGYTHYDGVHWYPRICVYDRKFGWDTFQHLGHEFYGDYGAYEVSLNFASNFVLGATGTLQNRSEVLPDSLREKLDIKNFANKPASKVSVITPYNHEDRKVWKFFAENVHDFAFTADPTYRIGEVTWNNIKVYALAEEPHASGWVQVAPFIAACLKVYTEDFGKYEWPQITAADARDGMEYPMLNLDGGTFPTNDGTYAHELGHEWFFGMLGNNETYRAALDEGFTQFIDSWAMAKIEGPDGYHLHYRNKYYDHFHQQINVKNGQVYLGYMNSVMRGIDEPLNTHSDAFNGALGHGGGYGLVYYKTATMLYNLQYVLGDSLFLAAMQHYVAQWKICHPYFEDFRNSIIQFTHVDLNWFFDEWMETTKNIDYGVTCVTKAKEKNTYNIHFRRYGRMEMPIDFTVIAKDKHVYKFYIPNNWYPKKTDATILPKWYGWDKIHPTYTATVVIPGGIKNVLIDPTHRLADINMLNNSKKLSSKLTFDSQINNTSGWEEYKFRWRPDLWWNAVDGFQPGLHLEGDYGSFKNIFSLTAWYNTGLAQNATYKYGLTDEQLKNHQPLAFNFSYRNNIDKVFHKTAVLVNGRWLDGLIGGSVGLETQANEHNLFTVSANVLYRPDSNALAYSLYPGEWQAKMWNNFVKAGWQHSYAYFKGNGKVNIDLRSSSLLSDYSYASISLTSINHHTLGKLTLNTRVYIQYGTGTFPGESALYLAGANPEQLSDDKYTRSRAFVPADWVGYGTTTNHFQEGGGLNLRGYAGYLIAENNTKDGNVYTAYKGNSGAAINAELQFDKLVKFAPHFTRGWLKLDTYLFGDGGVIGYQSATSQNAISAVRVDAGVGATLTIKHFWVLEKVKPLTLRFDVPFFVNRPPNAEPDYFKFRWVVGINRAF